MLVHTIYRMYKDYEGVLWVLLVSPSRIRTATGETATRSLVVSRTGFSTFSRQYTRRNQPPANNNQDYLPASSPCANNKNLRAYRSVCNYLGKFIFACTQCVVVIFPRQGGCDLPEAFTHIKFLLNHGRTEPVRPAVRNQCVRNRWPYGYEVTQPSV